MWLAAHAPERIDRLVLCNTAPRIGPPEKWNTRIDAVRKGGLESIAKGVVEGWFTARFREREPDLVRRMRAMLIASPRDGYIASCAAVRDMDQWSALAEIHCPTLIVSGTHDVATPVADGRRMASEIRDAQYVELDAAHISNIEAAEPFTADVSGFLDR